MNPAVTFEWVGGPLDGMAVDNDGTTVEVTYRDPAGDGLVESAIVPLVHTERGWRAYWPFPTVREPLR